MEPVEIAPRRGEGISPRPTTGWKAANGLVSRDRAMILRRIRKAKIEELEAMRRKLNDERQAFDDFPGQAAQAKDPR